MPVQPVILYEKDRGQSAPVPIFIEPDPGNPKRAIYRTRGMTYKSWAAVLRVQGIHGHMSQRQYARPKRRPGMNRAWRISEAASKRALGRAEEDTLVPASPEVTVLEASSHSWWAERIDTRLTVSDAGETVPVSHTIDIEPVLGVDLGKRHHEVAKLLFAGFGTRIFGMGLDPEDVLQEVFKGILIRNRGRGAFDPRKASFGHYVHMVCGCVLSNYQRTINRIRRHEQIGVSGYGEDGEWQANGLDLSSLPDPKAVTDGMADALVWEDFLGAVRASREGRVFDRNVAAAIAPLVWEGRGRKEIAGIMGLHRAVVSKALSLLRRVATTWMEAVPT